jgi:hypothetical protein
MDMATAQAKLAALLDSLQNIHLKDLLSLIVSDEAFFYTFITTPAAKRNHHATIGGLLEHSLGMAGAAEQMAIVYPSLNRDLLIAGALLHDLGKVEEIMLDLKTGRAAYVVISFGRVNWMPNNKLFAVPWEALSISFHDKKFILKVSEDTLKSAPGFDRDKWPEVADFGWLAKEFPVPMNMSGTGNDKLK